MIMMYIYSYQMEAITSTIDKFIAYEMIAEILWRLSTSTTKKLQPSAENTG